MKHLTIIFVFISGIILHSCSVEDPLPTSGENSFVTRMDGKQFIAENTTSFPSGTNYGLLVFVRNNSWRLTVTNSSQMVLFIYIHNIEGPGNYLIKDGNGEIISSDPGETPTSVVIRNSSLDLLYVSKLQIEEEYIKITEVQGDSIIKGEFDKITLIDPDNPNKKAILTNGKFYINRNTLNQPDP